MFSTRKLLALLDAATPKERQAINMFAILMLFSNFFEKVKADICFESKEGNDYTLSAINEGKIYKLLQEQCGAYQDPSYNNCAVWFVDTLEFGKGLFGSDDPVCTLDYHIIIEQPDLCIYNVLKDNCKDGTMTAGDIAAITLLAALVLLIGSVIAVCCARRQCNNPERIQLLRDAKSARNNTDEAEFMPPEEQQKGSSRMDDLANSPSPRNPM